LVTRADRVTTGRAQQEVYYSDFLDNLNKHPSTGLLNRKLNEDAVKQSIKNLVLTDRGERFFQPTVGGDVRKTLFNLVDEFSGEILKNAIVETLWNNEPRIGALDVKVSPNPDANEYRVFITFSTKTIQTTSTLEIVLTRLR
jgi:phage baseplate assembly protein W